MAKAIEQLRQAMEACELGALSLPDQIDALMDAGKAVLQEAPTLTPPNELLTVDDLLDMSHTPIWVMDTIVNRGEWCYWKDGRAYSCESHPEYYDLEDYGKWTAYRQPPRGCRYGRNML